jgi:hypothetical protein
MGSRLTGWTDGRMDGQSGEQASWRRRPRSLISGGFRVQGSYQTL